MATILCIETATTNCSVAISVNGNCVEKKEDFDNKYSHAERLHVYIDEVLQEAGVSAKDLDAIAVSKGPGSYTGLRIGVSAAKGLCFALDIPLIAIPTLDALAHQVTVEKGFAVSMLDARRMEVYSAVFNQSYEQIRETKAEILNENSFDSYLKKDKVYFIGNGVEKTKSIIKHPNAVFVENSLPSAQEMCYLADMKYKKSDIEDVAYFEPFYLKDFIAIKSKKI